MFPVLSLVVAVIGAMVAADLGGEGIPWEVPDGWVLVGAFLLLLAPLAVGQAGYLWARRTLARPGATWEAVQGSVARARLLLRLSPPAAYLALLFLLGWAAFLERAGVRDWILVDEVLLLLPYFAILLVSWVQDRRIVGLIQAPGGTMGSSILFRLRLLLVPVAPLTMVALGRDVIVHVGLEGPFLAYEYLGWGVLVLFVVVLFLGAPFLVRSTLGARPLPRGEVRESLLAVARAMGFRFRDILVWNTGGRFLNAAVVGLSPRLRYVLLTDLLLARLPAREVEAVFAHEAAHGVSRHAPLYLLYSLVFLLAASPAAALLPDDGLLAAGIGAVAVFVLYWFVLFGFVSRRAEREADLLGATGVGDPEGMIGALERIGFLGGEKKGRLPAWRHDRIERRVALLRRLREDPSLLGRTRRARRRAFALTLVGLAAALALAVGALPRQQVRGRVQLALYERDLERLERAADSGMERYPGDPWFVYMKGVGAAGLSRIGEARALFLRALGMRPSRDLARSIRKELGGLGMGR